MFDISLQSALSQLPSSEQEFLSSQRHHLRRGFLPRISEETEPVLTQVIETKEQRTDDTMAPSTSTSKPEVYNTIDDNSDSFGYDTNKSKKTEEHVLNGMLKKFNVKL